MSVDVQQGGEPAGRGQGVLDLESKFGLRVSDIALATGADERTVRRWKEMNEERRRSVYDDRIDLLYAIVFALSPFMATRLIRTWLRSQNPYLEDERPYELLRSGRFDEVLAAAHAASHGALPNQGPLGTGANGKTPPTRSGDRMSLV